MATWPGERNGVKGTYLDSPFAPRFFPDTEEGSAQIIRQIDFEIRMVLLGAAALLAPATIMISLLAFMR